MKRTEHITPNTPLGQVISHPAFAGFGQFLFPIQWGYETQMPVGQAGRLLPYHSGVTAEEIVDTVNAMVDRVNAGALTFHPIYPERVPAMSRKRKETGMFFFHGTPGAPFAVICPGGAFSYVGSIHEGFPIALALARRGYNAFVLQYRVGDARSACEDLAAALTAIFQRAGELGVSTQNYSLWGGSAGARVAAYLGSYGSAPFGGEDLPRPAAVIMAYTGHWEYTREDPPTYAIVGDQDLIASPRVMERRIQALKKLGIDGEFHCVHGVPHGFGLGTGTPAEGWVDQALQFWERHSTEQKQRPLRMVSGGRQSM